MRRVRPGGPACSRRLSRPRARRLPALLALTLLAAAFGGPRAAVIEEIVVKINNRIITKTTLEERTTVVMRQVTQQYPGSDQQAQLREAHDEILADLITEGLLLERAETIFDIDHIKMNLIDDFKKQQNIESDKDLEAALKDQGMTRKELEDQLMRLAVPKEIINYDVKRKISVSETELQTYYDTHLSRWQTPATVTFSEIVLLHTDDDTAAVKERADDVVKEARGGADFQELVQRYSEAGTREQQGLMGPFPATDLQRSIATAAFALEPGQTSEPIDTGRSFQVIKLEAKTPEIVKPLMTVREEVYNLVREEKFKPRFENYLKRLWKDNYIEIAPKYQSLLVVSPLNPRTN